MSISYAGWNESQATFTINGVPCAESVYDYVESADRESGPLLSKTFLCTWTKRFTVANYCLGLVNIKGGRNGQVARFPPLQHPEISTCWCSSVRITGKGRPYQGDFQIAYPVAVITVTFKAYPWQFGPIEDRLMNIDPDPANSFIYCTQEIDFQEESVRIPATALKDNGIPNQNDATYGFSHAVMRLTYNRLPYIPVATLPYMNYVNATTFLGCDKGKVKFKGSATHRQYSANSVVQSVTNTYVYRPAKDWNYVFNPQLAPSLPLWIERKFADGQYIFAYGDLTKTFPSNNPG